MLHDRSSGRQFKASRSRSATSASARRWLASRSSRMRRISSGREEEAGAVTMASSLYRTQPGEALAEGPLERLAAAVVPPESSGQLIDEAVEELPLLVEGNPLRTELRGGPRKQIEAPLERAADRLPDRRDVRIPQRGRHRRAHRPHPLFGAARRTQRLRQACRVEQEVSLAEGLHGAVDPLAQEEIGGWPPEHLPHDPADAPAYGQRQRTPLGRAGEDPGLVLREVQAPALSELAHHLPVDQPGHPVVLGGERNQGAQTGEHAEESEAPEVRPVSLLHGRRLFDLTQRLARQQLHVQPQATLVQQVALALIEIGRASCRERV